MDNKVNYSAVGIFVVLLTAALIAIFSWLAVKKPAGEYKTYLTYMREDVTGLTVQSAVRYAGVQVGYVRKITLDPNNPQLVVLTLNITAGSPITTSTVATLLPMGITGVIYVGLNALTPKAAPLLAKSGARYPVIPSKPSLLRQVSKVLPELTDNIKRVGDSITKLLSEKNRAAIDASLHNMSVLTKNLADNSGRLTDISKSLQITLKNTALISKRLPDLADNFGETLQNIKQTSVEIRSITRSTKLFMRDSHMMVENINDQVLPGVQQMLETLRRATGNVQQLSAEAQRNPSMFIRGKLPKQLGPGE